MENTVRTQSEHRLNTVRTPSCEGPQARTDSTYVPSQGGPVTPGNQYTLSVFMVVDSKFPE